MSPERLPDWARKTVRWSTGLHNMKVLLRKNRLHTVCEEARCPNMGECFDRGTATFMILGDICTRRCGFCSVETGRPAGVDPLEPRHLCDAVERLGLKHVVITSPARDDLPDGGAGMFALCVATLRQRLPHVTVEVLTPDFKGVAEQIHSVLRSGIHIYNHNIETVERLQRVVRPAASYARSLAVLRTAAEDSADIRVKSGLMLGLGEREEEVFQTLQDLRASGCDMLTVGQYLRPSKECLPVAEYVRPEVFDRVADQARRLGFHHVASGPFVRSSYFAERSADEMAGVVRIET